MGIFSTSPFDADIEKATDEKNISEDWTLIMDICDKVGSCSTNAKDCLRSIMKRLTHQDPHVAMQAVTLLDACVSNCGRNFHLEVASREFETEFCKLLRRSHSHVSDRLKQLLKKWAEGDFKSDPQLNLIPSLYHKLKHEGVDFSSSRSEPPKPTMPLSRDPNVVSSQQEEEDIAKAIELSLKETSQQSPKTQSSLYPSTNLAHINVTTVAPTTAPSSTEVRKVRALYDFEAAEDNELTFSAGEIIHVTDDTDPNWWKGFTLKGEGLFPSNFVTADLSVEPENLKHTEQPKKSVQFNESVQVKTVDEPKEVEIDEGKIDRLLHLLHEADPTEDQSDSEELLSLEEQVNAMGPLIDQELERVDRKHAQLTQLSSDLVEALNLYHTLMREPPTVSGYHTMPKPGTQYGYSPQAPPHVYNGLPPSGSYGAPSHGPPPPHGGPPHFQLPRNQYGMSPGTMTLPPHFHMGPPGVPQPQPSRLEEQQHQHQQSQPPAAPQTTGQPLQFTQNYSHPSMSNPAFPQPPPTGGINFTPSGHQLL